MNDLIGIPGVYQSTAAAQPRPELATGVPVFLGYANTGSLAEAVKLTAWPEFVERYGPPLEDGYLGAAVRGFFVNGGATCYVTRLRDELPLIEAVTSGMSVLDGAEFADLVCLPDAARAPGDAIAAQRHVLESIYADHRIAILDTLPGEGLDGAVVQWQQLHEPTTAEWSPECTRNGALYFPWVRVPMGDGSIRSVPPCGHIAGVIARTDRRVGVFQPPANEVVEGITDLETTLTAGEQRQLDPHAVVNCLRAFPGRGIRVWGARTTSGEPEWRHVSVRRLVLTMARWFELQMADVVMEPNAPELWARIRREVNDYLFKLFRAGALRGATPQEAYFLRCDDETTPAAVRDRGEVCVMVGIAPVVAAEFLIVRLVHGAAAVSVGSVTDARV